MDAALGDVQGGSPSAAEASKASRLQVEYNASLTSSLSRCAKAKELAHLANESTVAFENSQDNAKDARLRLEAYLVAKRKSFLSGEGPLPRRFMKEDDYKKEREGIRGGNPNVRYITSRHH